MDKYDLSSDGVEDAGVLSVLEYQKTQSKPTTTKLFTNLYVRSFSEDPDFTNEQLREVFNQYGQVLNSCVMRDENGKSKGFGFVSFVTHEEA